MCKRGETEDVWIRRHGVVAVDRCIAPIVRALSNGNIETIASCCGHGIRPGNIALRDGRELIVCNDYLTARTVEAAFPALAGEHTPEEIAEANASNEAYRRRECD